MGKKKVKPILSKAGQKRAKKAISKVFQMQKDKYNDEKNYGFLLEEDLKRSEHYINKIESVLKKPIRKKLKRINETQFSLHLINGEFILCTKVTKFRGYWIFSYKHVEKDTRQVGFGKYELMLEDDFFRPIDKFTDLVESFNPQYEYADSLSYIKHQASIGAQLMTLWKALKKPQRAKFKNHKVVLHLNLK